MQRLVERIFLGRVCGCRDKFTSFSECMDFFCRWSAVVAFPKIQISKTVQYSILILETLLLPSKRFQEIWKMKYIAATSE